MKVSLSIPDEVMESVDLARGRVGRSRFVSEVLRAALARGVRLGPGEVRVVLGDLEDVEVGRARAREREG